MAVKYLWIVSDIYFNGWRTNRKLEKVDYPTTENIETNKISCKRTRTDVRKVFPTKKAAQAWMKEHQSDWLDENILEKS